MGKKTYGTTPSGVPITDELIEKLAAEAEAGYDVDEVLRKRLSTRAATQEEFETFVAENGPFLPPDGEG